LVHRGSRLLHSKLLRDVNRVQKPPRLARLLRSPLPTCLQRSPPLPASGNKQLVPAPLGILRKVNAACEGPEPPLTGAGKPPSKPDRGPGLPTLQVTSSAPPKAFASSFDIYRLCTAKASISHPHVSPPAFPPLRNQQEFQAEGEARRSTFAGQAGGSPSALGLLLKAAADHSGFPAPRQRGAAVGLRASSKGERQQRSYTWPRPTARSTATQTLGLDLQTSLLGWAEEAWRCSIQASSKNKSKA